MNRLLRIYIGFIFLTVLPSGLKAFTNGQAPDYVLNFRTFTQSLPNRADTLRNTLYNPYRLQCWGGHLFARDYNNYRILVFNSHPSVWDVGADTEIGLCDLDTGMLGNRQVLDVSEGPARADALGLGYGQYYDGTHLFVADSSNNRVLIFNDPFSNGATASVVVGQVDFTSNSNNQGGSPNAKTLDYPYAVYSDGIHMAIADTLNNRVLIYNSIPVTNNAAADFVLGQSSMGATIARMGGTNTLYAPKDVFGIGTTLVVSDSSNNRVLIFWNYPTSNAPYADVLIGQSGTAVTLANQGGSPGANTLYGPTQSCLIIDNCISNGIYCWHSTHGDAHAPFRKPSPVGKTPFESGRKTA